MERGEDYLKPHFALIDMDLVPIQEEEEENGMFDNLRDPTQDQFLHFESDFDPKNNKNKQQKFSQMPRFQLEEDEEEKFVSERWGEDFMRESGEWEAINGKLELKSNIHLRNIPNFDKMLARKGGGENEEVDEFENEFDRRRPELNPNLDVVRERVVRNVVFPSAYDNPRFTPSNDEEVGQEDGWLEMEDGKEENQKKNAIKGGNLVKFDKQGLRFQPTKMLDHQRDEYEFSDEEDLYF